MRRAMVWVAAIALAMAVLRYPVQFVQKTQRFHVKHNQGRALIDGYRAQCPPGIAPSLDSHGRKKT